MTATHSASTATQDNTSALINQVVQKNPMHKGFIENALKMLTSGELEELEQYLVYLAAQGLDIDYLAACYLTIVQDTLKETIYFTKHRKYRNSTFAEVAGDVYHNKEYMDRYMYGLAISDFFWPNHVKMTRFFKETLPTDQKGAYLEIGPGHGYYIMKALANSSYESFLGIDLSEASIKQTKAIIDYFQPSADGKYELQEKDFLKADDLQPGSFNAIVMGEVLEHVEQPQVFLDRIAELASDDAHIYITTCANAPAVDHIFLYESTQQLEDQFEKAGLEVKESCILPYEGKTLEFCVEKGLAVNMAYTLRKK